MVSKISIGSDEILWPIFFEALEQDIPNVPGPLLTYLLGGHLPSYPLL